jgi:ABC-type polysaccharide/polyol phosphate transport system ATPase subunit
VEFDALRDVSFSVRRGESVAVLGRNGAGKSTLLKIIAGVVGPDSGTVNVCGHVSPLLALAAGFAPDLSGRRNTYLYGALLGMSRREVRTRLDSIVQFSEIGDFLDTPVKHYSTGMYVRLAFSIVAHLDPTILLVDEVLAVGDVGFQAKCLARIRELREVGKTLIVVTHGPQLAIDLCDRAILLDHGAVVADGDPDQVGAAYSTLVNQSL